MRFFKPSKGLIFKPGHVSARRDRVFFFNAGGRMKKDELERRYKVCKAMAEVCKKRKEFYLEKFYRNAAKGFLIKLEK